MSEETDRELFAFERGLILGCALGNGQKFTTQQIAALLGYRGQRDGYNGAHKAMARARVPGLVQDEDGKWELRIDGEDY